MKVSSLFLATAMAAASLTPALSAHAKALNDPVVGVADPESLFTDSNPKLNRNKQAALGIMKVLLECNQWDKAGDYLTDKYIQHNPNAKSGLAGVVYYFVNIAKRKPSDCNHKMKTPVVAVIADGDYVTVMTPRSYKDPSDPNETYTTTWFDTWRFVDGKADEHWDPATLPPAK